MLSWRNSTRGSADAAEEAGGGQALSPEHSRGGFACVILDRRYNVAFRLEPMPSAVDAAAWLAFHVVLEMFGVKAASAVDRDRPPQVFQEDRGLSQRVPLTVWNQSKIVRCYQDPTLDAFSRHVVKQRNKVLRKVRDQPGLVGDIVVGASEAGKAESMIMTPRLWFWHKLYMRPVPEVENKSVTKNDFVRRVRGRELADALCHPNSSTCVCDTPGREDTCPAPMHGPQVVLKRPRFVSSGDAALRFAGRDVLLTFPPSGGSLEPSAERPPAVLGVRLGSRRPLHVRTP